MPEINHFGPLGQRRMALDIAFRRHPYDDDKAMRLAPQLVGFLFQEMDGSGLDRVTGEAMPDSLIDAVQEALGFEARGQDCPQDTALTSSGDGGGDIADGDIAEGGGDAAIDLSLSQKMVPEEAPPKMHEAGDEVVLVQQEGTGDGGSALDTAPPATGAPATGAPPTGTTAGPAEPTFLVPTGMAARVLVLLANRQRQGDVMPGNGEIDRTLKLTKNGAAYAINYLTGKNLLHKDGHGRDRILTVTAAGLATVDSLARGDSPNENEVREEEVGEDEGSPASAAQEQPEPVLPESADPVGAVQPPEQSSLTELPSLTEQPIKLLATIRRMTFAGVCTATNAYLAAASSCGRGAAGRSVVVLRDAGVIDVDADSTRGRTIRITEKGKAVLAGLNAEETDQESAAGKADGGDRGGAMGGADADEPEEDAGPAAAPSGGESRRAYARGSDALGAALARSGMRFDDDPRAKRPEKVMCAIPTREVGGGSGLADVVG
jgi:hypothetical protein